MNKYFARKATYITIILIYFGVFLLGLPYLLRFTFDFSSILNGGGVCLIISGILVSVYTTLSNRIDSISMGISSISKIGIEQIISAENTKLLQLEEFIQKSQSVKIAINICKISDKEYYLLNSLFEINVSEIKLILMGSSDDDRINYFEREILSKNGKNLQIKSIEDTPLDNMIIINEKSYVAYYNGYDSKLSFYIAFNADSIDNQKNQKLFVALWDRGKLCANIEEE